MDGDDLDQFIDDFERDLRTIEEQLRRVRAAPSRVSADDWWEIEVAVRRMRAALDDLRFRR